MLRSSFDPRGPKKNDEHPSGFKPTYTGSRLCMCAWACVCMFNLKAWVHRFQHAYACWDYKHNFKPIMCSCFSFTFFFFYYYSNVVFPFSIHPSFHLFPHYSCDVFSVFNTNIFLELQPTHVECEEQILLVGNLKLEVANYSRIYRIDGYFWRANGSGTGGGHDGDGSESPKATPFRRDWVLG